MKVRNKRGNEEQELQMNIHAYHGDTHKPVFQVHLPQNPYCIYAAVVSTPVERLS
jgi:hypothetical protein